ncbi:hypothetical protein MARBORIA2_15680 [Methanobrevibacter arboriphilus]|jgi:hypothetical protein|uniref:Uncharacterized protein n=1 Tax=Methanobrevibacter arboriphilus TaxID=39441 RepID=A0ACA8R461_METAZ|nr:hypothetical protein [Methanobrevibacter arboriphilus]MCC7562047.1 hypothetical protein [Methanobrevibacter arboriphilus]BBL61650.1 hypothetical protein MarbSA_06900 [Methanobrevibacter arboriphilus]GLI12478.1 hypothetical protein MARBORIA2_15680 [Methanobrevibacter arboriphilus]
MANIVKIFGGLVLVAAGIIIIYESYVFHLIDIFTIFGIILFIIGTYLLILSFFERGNVSKLKDFQKNLNNESKGLKLDGNLKNKNNIKSKNNSLNKNIKKTGLSDSLGNSLTNNKLGSIDTNKIKDKVKNTSKRKNSKSVLKPINPKSNENNKKLRFTPNYEKPMKVTRRPQKKNKKVLMNDKNNHIQPDNENLNTDGMKKSDAIVKALASDDFIRPVHNESSYTNLDDNINNDNINKIKDNINEIEDNFNINDNDINKIPFEDDKNSSKFLRSYVICSKGAMNSKDAFEELAKHAKKEISLKIDSINDIDDDKFLSKLSSLDVRIIIKEFDIKNMSHVLLITSLLEQGVEIKTLPSIDTINLVADESNALIIYNNDSKNDLDVGAVYNDLKSISNIKSMFDKSWKIADDLKI